LPHSLEDLQREKYYRDRARTASHYNTGSKVRTQFSQYMANKSYGNLYNKVTANILCNCKCWTPTQISSRFIKP